jgi:hypothetical protein
MTYIVHQQGLLNKSFLPDKHDRAIKRSDLTSANAFLPVKTGESMTGTFVIWLHKTGWLLFWK